MLKASPNIFVELEVHLRALLSTVDHAKQPVTTPWPQIYIIVA